MTQPPLEPAGPQPAGWPLSQERTVFLDQASTLVDPVPPGPAGPAGPGSPPPPAPDRGIGLGLLLGLGLAALIAAGIAVAYLLAHRSHGDQATTVVITSAPVTTAPQTTGSAARRLPARIAVPDVTGGSLAAAESKLRSLGLRFATTSVTSDRPAGTVVEQVPTGTQKVAKGASITLSVARNATTTSAAPTTSTSTTSTPTTTAAPPAPATPANATVPDGGGQTEQSAVTAFSKAGILASLAFVPSQDPLGTVEQQAKAAGTTVPYHAHVQINISRGPGDKPDETVPSVTGKTLADAVAALNGAQLRLIYVRFPLTSRSGVGTVVQQSPLAGGRAPKNAQVLVFLGVYRR